MLKRMRHHVTDNVSLCGRSLDVVRLSQLATHVVPQPARVVGRGGEGGTQQRVASQRPVIPATRVLQQVSYADVEDTLVANFRMRSKLR